MYTHQVLYFDPSKGNHQKYSKEITITYLKNNNNLLKNNNKCKE